MAVIDADSAGLHLCTMLIVTLLAILSTYVLFSTELVYLIRRSIFKAVRCLSKQAYGGCTHVDPTGGPTADFAGGAVPAADLLVLQDFDTHAVNLANYLDANADSNTRLDVLNEEPAAAVRMTGFVASLKLLVIVGLLLGALVFAMQAAYGTYLSPFGAAMGVGKAPSMP